MNGTDLQSIRSALTDVEQTLANTRLTLCDRDDLQDLMDRVRFELQSPRPNVPLVCTFLNSIARSLRAEPEARQACLAIERAITDAGQPSTWQSGI